MTELQFIKYKKLKDEIEELNPLINNLTLTNNNVNLMENSIITFNCGTSHNFNICKDKKLLIQLKEMLLKAYNDRMEELKLEMKEL